MNIKITNEYITLGQLLKKADFVQTGGEAKFAVKSMTIKVNGEPENRRGRKLYKGDELMIEGTSIKIS